MTLPRCVPPLEVDWCAVLRAIGRSDGDLMAALALEGFDVSRMTISNLRRGQGVEPRYKLGVRLLQLAGQVRRA